MSAEANCHINTHTKRERGRERDFTAKLLKILIDNICKAPKNHIVHTVNYTQIEFPVLYGKISESILL